MRILFLTSRVPYPPWRGDKLRTFNILKQAAKNNDVHLVSFYATKNEKLSAQKLKKYVKKITLVPMPIIQSKIQVYASILSPLPAQNFYYHSSLMKKAVEKALKHEPKVIYCHLFRMASYVWKIKGIYKILDLTDLISVELRRSLPYRRGLWKIFFWLEALKISFIEKFLPRFFEETWLISDDEKKVFTQSVKRKVIVMPNGVDIEFTRYKQKRKKFFQNRIMFLGYFGELYNHNLDAVFYFKKEILPKIIQVLPKSEFIVVGNSVNELKMKGLIEGDQTKFFGFVPNLPKAISSAAVLICPLRFAAGVQNKILQAMALGVPVITTSFGNEGIGAKPNEEIIIADSREDFAKKVVIILKNQRLRKKISLNARKFVLKKFKWDIFGQRFKEIKGNLYKLV
ncbi:MAG: glycosyltransferase [Patescibacteria group bacterium]|nr:glycosyltransferase [Patescibacteria group bacterium]